MARPLRIEFPFALYHAGSRGNAKETIFVDDADRRRFLGLLKQMLQRHCVRCHAYCLMGNHYHLLLETPRANLSRAMQQLNGVYAQTFNERHDRVGHVFQGRYYSSLIQDNLYLLEVGRYIVLNPVRSGLVTTPDRWPWSSYRATGGLTPVPSFLTVTTILGEFGESPRAARAAYRRFVAAGVHGGHEMERLARQLRRRSVIGDPQFVLEHTRTQRLSASGEEFPRTDMLAARPELNSLFVPDSSRQFRNARIVQAIVDHGYSAKAVADFLGVHYTTISKVLRNRKK